MNTNELTITENALARCAPPCPHAGYGRLRLRIISLPIVDESAAPGVPVLFGRLSSLAAQQILLQGFGSGTRSEKNRKHRFCKGGIRDLTNWLASCRYFNP